MSKKSLVLDRNLFIFIVAANLLALLPGFLGSFFVETSQGKAPLLRSPDSDLTTTAASASISVLAIWFFSWHALEPRGYLREFFNSAGSVKFVVGFFEIISESVKTLSFSFHLFGNVFAGETLVAFAKRK